MSLPLCSLLPLASVTFCTPSLQSRPTLCDPMDCSPPGSSVHGLLFLRPVGHFNDTQGFSPKRSKYRDFEERE